MCPFTDHQHGTTSSQVVDRIMAMLRNGSFPPGSKLPPERRIAQELGVSRPSLREALAALEIVGMVETKPGMGTYVRSTFLTGSVQRNAALSDDKDAARQAWEARGVFEPETAALAAQDARPDDLARIDQILADMRDIRFGGDVWDRYEREFHLSVARATHNEFVVQTMKGLLDIWFSRSSLWEEVKRQAGRNLRSSFLEVHGEIYRCIARHDADGARHAARRHHCLTEEGLQRSHLPPYPPVSHHGKGETHGEEKGKTEP